MVIALETNGLYTTQAGVARYIRGLIQGFKEAAPADFRFFPVAWPVENFAYRQPQRAIKTFYRELVWAPLIAPSILRSTKPDLLHQTVNCLIPPQTGLPQVISIMDVAFLLHPERFRAWQRFSWKRALPRLHSAERFICISRFTADEVTRLLGIPSKKLEVVYLASDFSAGMASSLPSELQIPSEFFLFVGSLEPGKNLQLLRDVYELARTKNINLPPLVIVGARWEGVAREQQPPPEWRYLGRQPDETLAALYQRALALVFPSKYEGFGLPLVESMTLKCPVLCSRVASLPEVAGEAALYAELTPDSYLKQMQELASNSSLRLQLIVAGAQQAKKFSWRKCAEETIGIYKKVLSRKH